MFCVYASPDNTLSVQVKVKKRKFAEDAGTIISFGLGVSDAEILEKEMYPEFSMRDLINLPNYSIYLKLMIDSVVSRPFSAETRLPEGFRNSE